MVRSGVACQDCLQHCTDLMELTAKPCRKLPTEGSLVTPKTEKETIASPPVPTKGLVAENPGEKSVEERLLEEEYHMLEEEAQYLEQLAILKSLEDEEQRLLEVEKAQLLLDVKSMANSTFPASSHTAPFPAGT